MPEIIYIPGALADRLGERTLEEQANHFANLAGRPVEIQTYGESTYHATRRFLGQPREGRK